MSTVGTLYDETIKFGYGKLLQSMTIPGGTVYAVFTTPFTTNYDTIMFEFVSPASTVDACVMGCRVSFDGGASFIAVDNYWWHHQYNYSYDAGGGYGSVTFSQTANAMSQQYQTASAQNTTPTFGELYIHRGGGFDTMQWQTCGMQANIDFISHIGGGMCIASAAAITGIQFFFNTSSFQSGSIIRCYGLKKGVFGS